MGRIRSILTIVVLVALTSVTAAAVVKVLRIGLPERPFRTSDDVLLWLAENDFVAADLPLQRRLARRMEEDFNRDIDWPKLIDSLDDEQQERFAENFSELMRIWFLGKVDAYFELSEENQQRQFLRDEMVNIFNWKIPYEEVIEEIQSAEARAEGIEGDGEGNREQLGVLFRWQDQFAKWQERSTPEELQKIGLFVSEVTLYLMTLQQSSEEWPGGRPMEVRRGPFDDGTEDRADTFGNE